MHGSSMDEKRGVLAQISSLDEINLDLGCGHFKKTGNWIGIDALDAPGVDIVGDVYDVLKDFPAHSVDRIHASHFFEHVPDVPLLLTLIQRILKPTGQIDIIVPHFSNPYFYSDYTHRLPFGLYSFSYLVHDDLLSRKVPSYGQESELQLTGIRLNFKSPIIINIPIRWIWERLFNLSTFMKEWYEDSWSGCIPCYEIHFVIRHR